jgi:hypothetical protein
MVRAAMNRFRWIFFALAVAPFAHADPVPIRLWKNGEFVSGYDGIIRRIAPGTKVELAPDKVVTIAGSLGYGRATMVYALEDGRVLRLPLGSELGKNLISYRGLMGWVYEGMEKLETLGVPSMKIYREESVADLYQIVEKLEPPDGVEHLYTLEDLVRGRIKDRSLADRMEKSLFEDFAPKTAGVRFVGDMGSNQIAYTRRGWVVMDLNDVVKEAKTIQDSTFFTSMAFLPIRWRVRLERAVIQERRTLEIKGTWADLILAPTRRCMHWLMGAYYLDASPVPKARFTLQFDPKSAH